MNAVNTLSRSCCVMLALILGSGCQERGADVMVPEKQTQTFPDIEQAVSKAKADLVALLREQKDLNLGVDVAAVEGSQPGNPVRRVELDFDKLLQAEAASDLDALVTSERDTVVPLVAGTTVVTIVEVAGEGQQWRIVGLGGKDIADDLNEVRTAAAGVEGSSAEANVTLYEVPNLQARVYGVKAGEAQQLFTNYGGRFSTRQAVDAATLIPVLRADAIEFQKTYGDVVKEKRLVR